MSEHVYCREDAYRKIEDLETECDHLKAELDAERELRNKQLESVLVILKELDHLQQSSADFKKLMLLKVEEIDRLKAEIEKLSCPHCGSDVDGKNWKFLAMKAKEALSLIMVNTNWQPRNERPNEDMAYDCAKEALSLFDEA